MLVIMQTQISIKFHISPGRGSRSRPISFLHHHPRVKLHVQYNFWNKKLFYASALTCIHVIFPYVLDLVHFSPHLLFLFDLCKMVVSSMNKKKSVVKHRTRSGFQPNNQSLNKGDSNLKGKGKGGFKVGPSHAPDGAYLGKGL